MNANAKPFRMLTPEQRAIIRIAARGALWDWGEDTLGKAIQNAPCVTGTLRRSGAVVPGAEDLAIGITFTTPYAATVHDGSRPHVIRARRAKTLAVPVKRWHGVAPNPADSDELPKLSKNGRYVILGKRVKHPGTRGHPYLKISVQANIGRLGPLAARRIREALRAAAAGG
ncbi:MAG: hypothetical protein ACM3ZU_07980 [Bacteroidota bacterium]